MSPERWNRIQDVFERTLPRDPAEWAGCLDELCGPDLELRHEVESLLRAHQEADSILLPFEHAHPAERIPDGSRSRVGSTFGHYQIRREAGRGGMGLVYEAHDLRLDRRVALKFLPAPLDADSEARARFLVEAKAAAALDHPNIATIYEVAEEADGQLFIAMAYYEGETVMDAIARGPIELEKAVSIVSQVAAGLEAAHRRGITHHDVKPANILVTADGVAKILDFGVAQVAGSEHSAGWNVMGTLAYMSPEKIRGSAADHRSDLWSLGVVLYEMLTGRKPFQGTSVAAMMYSILNDAPAPLPVDVAGVQPILARALAKDVTERYQRVSEIVAELEPLRRLFSGSSGAPRDNLPEQPTSFVGRAREIEAVDRLLERARLVTLTGPGGTGKTRLALEIARRRLEDFPDGAFFVPLGSLFDPALVPPAIARAVGHRETRGGSLDESLQSFLGDRTLLLVLDNFEHVADATPFVAELLGSCRGIRILATSRVPLHLSGEQEFPVPPLSLPSSESAPAVPSEAIELFVERARAIQDGFRLTDENRSAVAEICFRLDGLPLAIELAAARVKVLPPRALLSRLQNRLALLTGGARDAPARHRTLRDAIGWSYNLLTREEKTLLRRLSVFSEGISLDAAEEVGRLSRPPRFDVVATIAALVDQSLLRQQEEPDGQPRFFMLETIQEFASECLVASGEEKEAHRAHWKFFLEVAESAAAELRGPEQATWLARLDREHGNLRRALERSSFAGETNSAARFCATLLRFWLVHGHLTEGRKAVEHLLDQTSDESDAELRGTLFSAAGTLAHNQGDFLVARTCFERSLALHRELGDDVGVADTLNHLGWVAWRMADYASCRTHSEEALALCRKADHARGIAIALNNLGWRALYQGDFRAARDFFTESLALQRQLADERGVAFALNSLGIALHELGEEEAEARLEEALEIYRTLGEKQLLAFILSNLAEVALSRGETDRALSLLNEGLPTHREIGDRWGLAHALAVLAEVHGDQGELDRARACCIESAGIRRQIGDRWGMAFCEARLGELALHEGAAERAKSHFRKSLELLRGLSDRAGTAKCLEGLALLAVRSGRAEEAARLLSASDVLRNDSGAPLRGRRAARHGEIRALLRDMLTPRQREGASSGARGLDLLAMIDLGLVREASPGPER